MGLSVNIKADWDAVDALFDEISGGSKAGEVVAEAGRQAIDKFIRKDSGDLADMVIVTAWKLDYTQPYAAIVWDVPPQIVSPENKNAVANPHERPEVAQAVADRLSEYAARLTA